jgi:Fe-S-cluster containining protein
MDYQELMYTTIEQFSAHIAEAGTPPEMQTVFEEARAQFETLRQAASRLPGNDTACEAGCAYCCYYTVSLRAHEIVQVLEHIRANFSKAEIAGIRQRAKQNRQRMKKLTHDQIEHTNIRCALLSEEGLCRCYDVRPLNCRRNNSRNAELCRQFHDDPTADLISDSALDIDQQTSLVIYALSEGFAQNGYDDSMYYLNHGLYEGLKSARPVARWHKQKKAFSRSAESKEYD